VDQKTPIDAISTAVPAGTTRTPLPANRIPGYTAPPIETATPAEIDALVSAEVARSAKSVTPKTYVGIDGKPHQIQYNGAGQSATEELRREDRRKVLMDELKANPAAFARSHDLSMKEVGWILDGSSDFPERLLD
jgi:hypothetical protein